MPKARKKTPPARVNKSAWIRSQPASVAAKDVVTKAKQEGIKLSLAQVYTARSSAKSSGAAPAPARRGPAPAAAPAVSSKATDVVDSKLQGQFMQLIVRLGTETSENLLERLLARGA